MEQKASKACISTERLVLTWYYSNIFSSRIVACHTRSVLINDTNDAIRIKIEWDTRNLYLQMTSFQF